MQPRESRCQDFCTHQGSGQSRSWGNHSCYSRYGYCRHSHFLFWRFSFHWAKTTVGGHWIPIHSLAAALWEKCGELLFWYAFAGCDIVSAFGRKNRLTAWATWQVFDEATPVFARYSKPCHSFDPHEDSVQVIEMFTCLLYGRASTVEYVNDCPRKIFTHRGQSVNNIPLTRYALVQHIRRAIYQAGYDEIHVLSMTPAPGSKQDKDNFSKFIYYVQRTFIILSHECYFPRTCIRLCLARLNVPCMCAYVIVFVCVYVFLR